MTFWFGLGIVCVIFIFLVARIEILKLRLEKKKDEFNLLKDSNCID
jgi:hypothetical protein